MHMKRNGELLPFGSDPVITPGTDSKEKLQTCVQVSIHGVHTAHVSTSVHHKGYKPRFPLTTPCGVHR